MNRKKFLAVLAMSMSLAGVLTACGLNTDKQEEQVVVEEVSPEPEAAETVEEATPTPVPSNLQGTSYKSEDGVISLEVPDTTWTIKAEEGGMVSFESPENGKILIMRGSGEALNSAVIPDSEDMANSLEKASSLEQGVDYELSNYSIQDVNGNNAITYTVKYLNTEKTDGVVTTLNKFFSNDNEYVSVAASAYKDDADLQAKIWDAANSLTIGGSSTLSGTAAPVSADAAVTESTSSSSSDFTEEQLNDTEQTRTINDNHDGRGTAYIVYKDSEGNWVDASGNTYRFMDDGSTVYDQNDVDYYYGGLAGFSALMPRNAE